MRWVSLMAMTGALLACGSESASPPPGDDATTGNGGSGTSMSTTTGNGGSTTTATGGGASTTSGAGGGAADPICAPGMQYGAPFTGSPTPTSIQGGYQFLEGPVWIADLATLFFSEMKFTMQVPPADMHKLAGPSPELFISSSGTNGLALHPDGDIVGCCHDDRSISRFDPVSNARTLIAGNFEGKKFNSPNDAVVRSDGTIYFTDPVWQLGGRPKEISYQGVFRITPSNDVLLVADDIQSPNGIALSPDETLLYVADDSSGNIDRWDVAADGSTSNRAPFAQISGVDGMAMDCAGNLYVPANPSQLPKGLRVIDRNGDVIGTIELPQKPNNVAFGGPDRKTLFIVTPDTLYSVQLDVPGLP